MALMARLPTECAEVHLALVERDAERAVGHDGARQQGHRVPGDLRAFVRLGVVRGAERRVFRRRVEEHADAGVRVAVAAVDGGGVADVTLGEVDAQFLACFADDGGDGGLGVLGFAAGQVPHAVGEAGALPQPEQDVVVPGQEQEYVKSAPLRVSHAQERNSADAPRGEAERRCWPGRVSQNASSCGQPD